MAERGKWDALLLNSSSGRNASNLLCLRRIWKGLKFFDSGSESCAY